MTKKIIFAIVAILTITFTLDSCSLLRKGLNAAKGMKKVFTKVSIKGAKNGSKVFTNVKYYENFGTTATKAITNLGKSSKKISAKVTKQTTKLKDQFAKKTSEMNKKILASKGRCFIKQNSQFIEGIIAEELLRSQDLCGIKDEGKLYKNMVHCGLNEYVAQNERALGVGKRGSETGKRSQTHHIVSGGTEGAAKSRSILTKFGIDINDANNGVILPQGEYCFAKGAKHGKTTNEYDEMIYQRLKKFESMSATHTNTQKLRGELRDIAKDLTNGKTRILSEGSHTVYKCN